MSSWCESQLPSQDHASRFAMRGQETNAFEVDSGPRGNDTFDRVQVSVNGADLEIKS